MEARRVSIDLARESDASIPGPGVAPLRYASEGDNSLEVAGARAGWLAITGGHRPPLQWMLSSLSNRCVVPSRGASRWLRS